MKANFTPNEVERNILKLYEQDKAIVSDSSRLTAVYWTLFDKLQYGTHKNVLEMLRSVTVEDKIQRGRRRLHEHGLIEYSEQADKSREKRYVESRDEYGIPVMIEMEG